MVAGTSASIAFAIKEWWKLVKNEPAAALVVMILFVAAVVVAAWAIDHVYEPRSDFQKQMSNVHHQINQMGDTLGTKLGTKLDTISCEVQWNRYSNQMQVYRVQERGITKQIKAQTRYLEELGEKASDHDKSILDALSSQLKYIQREEAMLPKPPCVFPFQE